MPTEEGAKNPLGWQGGGLVSKGVCSAQRQEPLRQTGWKEEAAATTGCNVRRQQLPGRGRAARSRHPRLPYRWFQGTETPRGQRARAYVRPLTLPRGIPGVPGASVPGKMPDRLPSPPLSPFRKSFKPGHNPDAPVPPRLLSSPGSRDLKAFTDYLEAALPGARIEEEARITSSVAVYRIVRDGGKD